MPGSSLHQDYIVTILHYIILTTTIATAPSQWLSSGMAPTATALWIHGDHRVNAVTINIKGLVDAGSDKRDMTEDNMHKQ